MKFIPATDLTTSALDAASFNELDYEFIQAGEGKSLSFRVGNDSSEQLAFTLTTSDSNFTIEPPSGLIEPGEISDTITCTLVLPLDVASKSNVTDLVCEGQTERLTLIYTAVGVNEERTREYPERRTSFTDNISDVIIRLAEPLKIYRFDPIAFDPSDTRVYFDYNQKRPSFEGEAGQFRPVTQSMVSERLSPTNETWGYRRSTQTVLANFQGESEAIRIDFASDNQSMTYTSTAQLHIPAEFELQRTWALFNQANGMEPETHKRTVFLFKRQGDLWCIHQIYPMFRGNELSFFRCECIQIHNRNMGSPDGFNPFALTFTFENDKPYAKFLVDSQENLIEESQDASGSSLLA